MIRLWRRKRNIQWEILMTVQELSDKLDALANSISILIARQQGSISPADLDPLGAKIDAQKAAVDAAAGVTPPPAP